MTTANDRQVGGSHYRTTHQHWDFAADMGLGYYEGQISKYITRHRHKNGLVDAEKALHFAEKLLELAKAHHRPIHTQNGARGYIEDFATANGLTEDEGAVVGVCCTWTQTYHLEVLITHLKNIVDTYARDTADKHALARRALGLPVNAVLHTPIQHATTQAQFDAAVDRRDRPSGAPVPRGYVDQDRADEA